MSATTTKAKVLEMAIELIDSEPYVTGGESTPQMAAIRRDHAEAVHAQMQSLEILARMLPDK